MGLARAARGFTLIELLAVVVIIGLLLATFVPYALSIRETANRTRCEKNLRDIHEAFTNYAAGNGYLYPRVRYDAAMGSRWISFTGVDDPNPFATNSTVSANDVTASLWLLVREGLAQPSSFVCPSGAGRADRIVDAVGDQTVVKKRGNFRSAENLNYAYATPFSTIPDYRLNDTLPARFALIADRPPSTIATDAKVRFDAAPRALRKINSPNHGGLGQNVLYADGSVSFEESPYCGVGRNGRSLDGDNIFTALADKPLTDTQPKHNEPGVVGESIGPAYRYDAMLVLEANWPVRTGSYLDVPRPSETTKPTTAAVVPPSPPTTTTAPATLPTTSPSTQP